MAPRLPSVLANLSQEPMTTTLFLLLMLLVVAAAMFAFVLSTCPTIVSLAKRHGTMPPPMIGAISILFGLFIGFSSAEITQRGGGLRLATQREVSAARSILNYTAGIGPPAYEVREATVEYLQVVTTSERNWLAGHGAGAAPGADAAFSLNLITTSFVQQPGTADVLKTALLNRVDDLTNARTERLTLGRMRAGGKVVLGARTDVFPFASAGPDGAVNGFSIDLCRAILERVRSSAGLGPVQVEEIALSPANRMAMIQNGTADMECDLTTETAGRDDAVDFLDTIFYGGTSVAVLAGSPLKTTDALKAKRLIAVTGSSNIQALNDMDARFRLGFSLVPARDTPEAFRMLAAGGGDALVSSDVLLRTLIAQSGHPGDYRLFDSGLGARRYGLMVRRGNTAFREAALRALHEVMRNGQFATLYDQWFTSAIPPDNVNLRLPMSAALAQKTAGAQ